MNAALIAACAANSARVAQQNVQHTCVVWDHIKPIERPIIGMIKVENRRDAVIVDDLVNDGVELRFRNVFEVNELIRKLESLRENMIVLEGD